MSAGCNTPDPTTISTVVTNAINNPSSPFHPPHSTLTTAITPLTSNTYKCSDGTFSANCAPSSGGSSGTPTNKSAGFIAGITIMCIVIAAAIAVGVWYYLKHKKAQGQLVLLVNSCSRVR